MNHMELQYFKTDKNGTKYFYDWKCPRCAGLGQAEKWRFTGSVCFECGGSGMRRVAKIVKEYTPEYWTKLEARRIAKQRKYAEEHAYEIAQHKAEQEAREEAWRRAQNADVCKTHGCGADGIGYVLLGETYEIKEQIKANGGKWIFGSWVCPVAVKANGVRAIRIDLNTCLNEYGRIDSGAAGDLIYDTQNGIVRE